MRETKAAANPAPARGAPPARRGINPLFAGIIIGLVLGVGLALGLALYLNRESNVFVDRTQPVAPLPAAPKSTVPPISPNTGQTVKADSDKPRFEFYQTLPGDSKGGAEPPSRTAGAPGESAARPTPHLRETTRAEARVASAEEYFLQAGAFQNTTDAENMRGKVAFAGFQAQIRSVNLPDKGTLYRVRLGPYKSLDEVNRIKGVLAQNGVGAAIVKSND
ncbi:MAG TPA: SPOR domain-containing protein [Usitatibacteraceae bacterium]|nr:SPOR domain-containing protein [Usitatibacteraceae bacterium]